jgi:hypothetical protein
MRSVSVCAMAKGRRSFQAYDQSETKRIAKTLRADYTCRFGLFQYVNWAALVQKIGKSQAEAA